MNQHNSPTKSAPLGSLSEIETGLKQFTESANAIVKDAEQKLLQTNIASATLPDVGRDQAKTVSTILTAYLPSLAKACRDGTGATITKALVGVGTAIAKTVPEILPGRAVDTPVTPDELIQVSKWEKQTLGQDKRCWLIQRSSSLGLIR